MATPQVKRSRGPRKDISGQPFGRWTALEYAGKSKWLCRCECGTERLVVLHTLLSGHSTSCGCFKAEETGRRRRTHGRTNTRTYWVWMSMKDRCHNPNCKQFHYYGGRGIYVCDRWRESFETFIADMGERPSRDHSIERIDNDGPYSPENCKWATLEEQRNNHRGNHLVTHDCRTMNITQWSKETGIPARIINSRINRYGWDASRALTTPVQSDRNRYLTYNGETLPVAEWAKRIGMSEKTIMSRIHKQGWSAEKALTTPSRRRTTK